MTTIIIEKEDVEPAAIRAWVENRTVYVERWESLDEDITVPGIVAGNFPLPYLVN